MDEGTTETVAAALLGPGDIVTLPGTAGRSRIQVARAAVPGVVWLYVVDAATGVRRRGPVALPLHRTVIRHAAGPVPRGAAQGPEDA
ncbi:hypothetical protein KVF89_20610 [Nocardioides carbamazepini]|uniref:hypothetical protein n=1 Tax=Nocardioides carbamazepini TaxID=2854259 RepID=UPI00214A3202|nr:hypothetical protein [Nocardioides carbamazepini]MCR1784955.1 hypothetical protein [Nocardioides carbamazepini]